ncbi:MAG: thioredoxin-dependent thiol peroxidase [Proteobacteria bacterium]|nr:thioredoxin-dependent thiol peroxidase [Pseudomonadota bacterium]
MALKIGDQSPSFKGMTAGGTLSLGDLRGSHIVLYFYPKDDTPGCTKEACAFRDSLPRFKKMNAKIFGVSKDDITSHEKFAQKYELPFTLISDENGNLCDSFGVWVEKSMYGKKYMGIERATYLIDKNGIIRNIWRPVKVDGHAEDVLSEVKKL